MDSRPGSPDKDPASPTKRAAKACMLCFEPGAKRRSCCRATYCDHCYVKNNKCPNCKTHTKQEKLTGATYQLKIFSEHEECRICLDPGLLRRCCGNYYCDTHYYQSPLCRSCGTPVTNLQNEKKSLFADRAYCFTVCLGWAVTVFVIVVTAAFIGVVIAADVATPVGINDFKCYGFFRTCDVSVCVEVGEDVAQGAVPLPALNTWDKCDLNSRFKLEAKTCVFDQNLYHQSGRVLGYDVCKDHFNEGVYVMEDTFEDWTVITKPSSSLMVSALWANVTNGQTDSECGVGQNFGAKRSLRFGGEFFRFAVTQDLDVRSGGQLEAEVFLPPIGYDAFRPLCKTGYIGTLIVMYSVNEGANWTVLASYDPALHRQSVFFPISLPLPAEALTNHTRFKFHQPIFEAARDNWALDNVRVLRYLPADWQRSAAFANELRTGQDGVQDAQCCADTDWCAKRLSEEERRACGGQFSWYQGPKYLFRLSEIFLCMAVLLNLLKFLYVSAFDYLVRFRLPFHDDLVDVFAKQWMKKIWRYIPITWRPRPPKRRDDIENIHRAARLEEKVRADFEEGEVEGNMLIPKAQARREQRELVKKVKKQQKKLDARRQKKNFKGSTVAVERDEAKEQELASHVLPFDDAAEAAVSHAAATILNASPDRAKAIDALEVNFAQDGALDEMERQRRQNLALLRVPFELEVDERFVRTFAAAGALVLTLLFLVELSVMPNYQIFEPLRPFGATSSTLYVNSYLTLLFAAYCDGKELWATVRYIVPLFPSWRPAVTLDLSDDRRSLFIGDYTLPLTHIREISAFPGQFSHHLVAGLALGCFPWAIMSILLRETQLTYASMRFVSPLLGTVVIVRAVLGPTTFVKLAFAFQHLFAVDFKARELIGNAVQQTPTWHTAVNVSLAFACLGAFFTAIAAVEWIYVVVPAGVFGGAVYGLFTGAAHHLAIKPWLNMTAMRSGVFLQVRKRQACPCVYWGRYCTAVHEYEEVLVLFTTDDIKFTSLLNNGISAVQTFLNP